MTLAPKQQAQKLYEMFVYSVEIPKTTGGDKGKFMAEMQKKYSIQEIDLFLDAMSDSRVKSFISNYTKTN